MATTLSQSLRRPSAWVLALVAALIGPQKTHAQAAAAVSGAGVSAHVQLPTYVHFGTSSVPAAVGPSGAWNFGWGPSPVATGDPAWWGDTGVPRAVAPPRPAGPPIPWNPGLQAQNDADARQGGGRRRDLERARQLTLYGDRNLRAGDLKRATMRYNQALAANPFDATLHVRRSQVALARGDYAEAVRCLDDALVANPRWLDTPPDLQSLHTEPARFRERMATIEARVQAFPEDRDAWLMLGAMLLMSGRAGAASDVFLRLTDEPPTPLLSSLLQAAQGQPPADAADAEARAEALGPPPPPPPWIAAP
jgi:hypothetical protein